MAGAVGRQWGNLGRQVGRTNETLSNMIEPCFYALLLFLTQSTFDLLLPSSVPDEQDQAGGERANNLLHQKLLEKNASLRRTVEAFSNENLGGACRQVRRMLEGCQRTQVFFQVRSLASIGVWLCFSYFIVPLLQDTVLSNQQSSHFCAEAIESADETLEAAKLIKFPT